MATSTSSLQHSPSAIVKLPLDTVKTDRPLITYVYYETKNARENILFFVQHGLHDGADFIFIVNGKSDIAKSLPDRKNIRVIQRANRCFDLGTHAEVLSDPALTNKYKRFILMNASIRGPFLPHWSPDCWSEAYLSKLTDTVKVNEAYISNSFSSLYCNSSLA